MAISATIATYFSLYVQEDIGITAAQLSVVLLISSLWDVFTTITQDAEVDDPNSLRHFMFYANEVDLQGIVQKSLQDSPLISRILRPFLMISPSLKNANDPEQNIAASSLLQSAACSL